MSYEEKHAAKFLCAARMIFDDRKLPIEEIFIECNKTDEFRIEARCTDDPLFRSAEGELTALHVADSRYA